MKKYNIRLTNGQVIQAVILNDELIYGATAIAIGSINNYFNINLSFDIKAIHPFTKDLLPLLVLENDKLKDRALILTPAHTNEYYALAKKYKLPIKQVVAPYFKGENREEIRQGKPTEYFKGIIALVHDRSNNSYLCIDNNISQKKSFIFGTASQTDKIETQLQKLVVEKTGYTDIKYISTSFLEIHSYFFDETKDINKYIKYNVVQAELNSGNKTNLPTTLAKNQEIFWISKLQLKGFLNEKMSLFVNENLIDGDKAYDGDGIMINSENLNGKMRSEIK